MEFLIEKFDYEFQFLPPKSIQSNFLLEKNLKVEYRNIISTIKRVHINKKHI